MPGREGASRWPGLRTVVLGEPPSDALLAFVLGLSRPAPAAVEHPPQPLT
ncbi:hypothetical protein WEB32_34100 [Streptomyces netropsis]